MSTTFSGMLLRDHFAGLAMQAQLQGDKPISISPALFAREAAAAYAIADTMVAARAPKAEPDAASVLRQLIHWAEAKCPCANEQPDPCPLCGASVDNLEACKAADSTLPPALLAAAREVLGSGGKMP